MTSSTNKPLEVQCPTCQRTVLWSEDNPERPFCSKRCQLVDFRGWATESYRVPASENEDFSEDDF